MAHSEGSFVRWQSTRITQFGYASNLILTLTAASLGFALSLVRDKDYAPGCWAKCMWLACVVALLAAIVLGVWCVVNRLIDFRKTAQNARDRETLEPPPGPREDDRVTIEMRLEHRRLETEKLGKRTWCLFCCQIATFGTGVLALIGAFLVAYHAKVF